MYSQNSAAIAKLHSAILETLEMRRLLSAGQLDMSFGTGGSVNIHTNFPAFVPKAEVVQSDGKILIGGFDSPSQEAVAAVIRLNANGLVDSSFGTNGEATFTFSNNSTLSSIEDLAVQSDGKIVAVGDENVSSGLSDAGIARLNANGTLDHSFSGDGVAVYKTNQLNFFTRVSLASGGKILAGGGGSGQDYLIARFNSNGSLDTSFNKTGVEAVNMGGDDELADLAATASGKILAVGELGGGTGKLAVVQLTSSGAIDSSFGSGGRFFTPINSFNTLFRGGLFVQADGSFIVAGTDVNGEPVLRDYSVNGKPTGFTSAAFNVPNVENFIFAAQDSSGNIDFLGLSSAVVNNQFESTLFILRATKAGKVDGTFGTNGIADVDMQTGGVDDLPATIAATSDNSILAVATRGGATPIVFKVLGSNGGSSGATLGADGTLTVNGTGSDDHINVSGSGTIEVVINGQTTLFVGVKSIVINGLGGDDTIVSSAAGSFAGVSINGGDGNDSITGGNGNDTVHGGAANDTIDGGLGSDNIFGDGGTDTVDYSHRTTAVTVTLDNVANDGAAGEKDNVSADIETILGGSGDDFLQGNPFANKLVGNGGNDTLWGGDGNDTLDGGAGHDHLNGQGGSDTLLAKDGQSDTLDGGDGVDSAQRDNGPGVFDSVMNVEAFAV